MREAEACSCQIYTCFSTCHPWQCQTTICTGWQYKEVAFMDVPVFKAAVCDCVW